MKERVCQLFEVCQNEFAHLSLPCEGRFKNAVAGKKTSELALRKGNLLSKIPVVAKRY